MAPPHANPHRDVDHKARAELHTDRRPDTDADTDSGTGTDTRTGPGAATGPDGSTIS
ncbi:hypothetical protein [Curtobacterium sp. ISL-83]|uniref:hypothetical protein n=1 Tax=Curtobacterium sp. ISL-83 TaxID=2819145 RepID=UPI001BEC51B2|nr:hypothetical protein [Curtobacterium sp. ISL-83]MBT2503015.1 hypothetical protein [Curtobacterium sp. ISL-83]